MTLPTSYTKTTKRRIMVHRSDAMTILGIAVFIFGTIYLWTFESGGWLPLLAIFGGFVCAGAMVLVWRAR